MADNIFKRVGRAIVNKSHSSGTFPLTSHTTTFFKLFNGFFNFSFGSNSFEQFTEAYGNHPLVYMIINKISTTSASIKRIAVDDNDEPITGTSQILDLLNEPNPEQSRIEFYENINENYEATGNAFIRHIQGIGAGNELRVLESDKVEILCNKFQEVIGYRYTMPFGGDLEIPFEEVLHIHKSNIVNTEGKDAKYGLSPLQAAWIVVKSSKEKFNAEASIFKNRGAAGMVTTDTDTPMLPKERQRMQDELDEEIGGSDNFNKIKVSSSKLRYLQMGMSPTDLKLVEGLINSLRTLCAVYCMPSVLFNDTERSTFNNFEMAVKTAYIDVYIPLGNKVDEKLSRFLSDRLGVDETIRIDLTSIEVIKASTNEVLQALNSMPDRLSVIAIQSLTDDEIREMVNIGALAEGQVTTGQAAQTTQTNEE